MTKEELTTTVYENVGYASMCWSETPKGVFDDADAKKVSEQILEAATEYAKQEAIGFEKFSRGNFQPFMASGLFVEKVKFDNSSMWPDLETITKYTHEETYNLYLQSKTI